MVVQPLILNNNEYALSLLEEVGRSKVQNAKHAAIVQNAAIYYQCLLTKRQAGTMSTAQRNKHARTWYKSFTAPSFLCWWKTKCGLDPPSWLTMDVMGKTTQTDKDQKFYTKDGLMWAKYMACGRDIRRDFNNIWDSFLVNGDLPSGQQAEDMWKHLQDQLWFLDRKEAQRRKDLAAANEARKASPVVIDEGKSDKTELGARSSVTSKWSSGEEQAEADADEDAMTTATTGGKERRKSVLPDSASEEEQGEGAVSVKNDPNAGGMVGDEEVEGDDEEKYGARPDNWTHPASLVFALFGRPAGKAEDVDLEMKMTSGVSSGRKRQAEGGASSPSTGDPCPSDDEGSSSGDSGGRLRTTSLQLMPGAGGKQSRANLKKTKHAEKVEKKRDEEARSDSEFKRKVLEALATPQVESATSRDIARSLAALNKSVEDSTRRAEDAARRAQWKQKVEAKEAQLQMLERRGKGDSEKALKIEEELNKLYDNPGVMPSVDDSQISTVGGGGSIDGSTGIGSRTGGHGGDKRAGVISVDEGSVSGGAEVLGGGDFFEVAGNAPEAVGVSSDVRI